MKGVTDYSGLSKFYFKHLLRQLVSVGQLERSAITILDFGCGKGELKRLLVGANVICYDIIPSLSEVSDWRFSKFDVLVANQVFFTFNEPDLDSLLIELKQINPDLELIIGISRQGFLNNLGKYLLGRPNAHSYSKIGYKKEVEILKRHCQINRRKNVLSLASVYSLSFIVS